MPNTRLPLVTEEFYHVYNRSIAHAPIFLKKLDYQQALLTLSYYSFKKPAIKLSRFKELAVTQKNNLLENLARQQRYIEIISFAFMPNHFHLLLKQKTDKGISTFISQFTNSYTKYFNTKYERSGPIFQGLFKYVHIETTEQLLHVSRYIHLNPIVSTVIKENELDTYPWTSFPLYMLQNNEFINPQPILENFSSTKAYKDFVIDHISYAKKLHQIKHLIIEND